MTRPRRPLGTGPRSEAAPPPGRPAPADGGGAGPPERGTAAERAAAEPHREQSPPVESGTGEGGPPGARGRRRLGDGAPPYGLPPGGVAPQAP